MTAQCFKCLFECEALSLEMAVMKETHIQTVSDCYKKGNYLLKLLLTFRSISPAGSCPAAGTPLGRGGQRGWYRSRRNPLGHGTLPGWSPTRTQREASHYYLSELIITCLSLFLLNASGLKSKWKCWSWSFVWPAPLIILQLPATLCFVVHLGLSEKCPLELQSINLMMSLRRIVIPVTVYAESFNGRPSVGN